MYTVAFTPLLRRSGVPCTTQEISHAHVALFTLFFHLRIDTRAPREAVPMETLSQQEGRPLIPFRSFLDF